MSSGAPVWQFQYSVECGVPQDFAWRYWSDVVNWDDPPAKFQLDGPFSAGSRITTHLPGQTLHSVIRQVIPSHEAFIDLQLPDAILTFHWKLESLSLDRTRITQSLELSGENAHSFVAEAAVLKQTTPEGMKKLRIAIEQAHQSGRL